MPYIKQEYREALRPRTKDVPESTGELNFQITCLLYDYMRVHGRNYKVMNDIIGAIEGAKLEFYRRKVAPYEDQMIKVNGDLDV